MPVLLQITYYLYFLWKWHYKKCSYISFFYSYCVHLLNTVVSVESFYVLFLFISYEFSYSSLLFQSNYVFFMFYLFFDIIKSLFNSIHLSSISIPYSSVGLGSSKIQSNIMNLFLTGVISPVSSKAPRCWCAISLI